MLGTDDSAPVETRLLARNIVTVNMVISPHMTTSLGRDRGGMASQRVW